MRQVSFKKLSLAGFGPYQDRVEVALGPGINTLVAPNESGKSSLVSGLLATVFGMPGKSDPSAFGQARFRNWKGPRRFQGEVELVSDGGVYRIWRDFDTHKVSLARFENGRYIPLVTGEHNPCATRKPNEAYERKLAELLGVTSRELFERTFCMTQPIPEARHLDEKVQELLSGAGGGFAHALERLADELSAQTKTTGDRGVTPQNQRKDRDLEVLTCRIDAIESGIQASRSAVDSLQAVLERLNDVEHRLDETREALASKESILMAWSEWRRLAADYRRATRDQTSLGTALDSAATLQAEVEAGARRARELFPEFEDALDGTESALSELITLRAQRGEAEMALSHAERSVTAKQAEIAALQAEMRTYRDWGALGPAPGAAVRAARRKVAELAERWQDFLESKERVSEYEAELAARFRSFSQAGSDELELVAVYSARLAELTREMDMARSRFEALNERMRAIANTRDEFQRRYAGIAAPRDQAGPLRRWLEAIRRERRLQAELEGLRRLIQAPRGIRAAVGFASAILATAAAWVLLGDLGVAHLAPLAPVLAVVAILFWLGGYAVSGFVCTWRARDAREQLKKTEYELAEQRRELGPLAETLGDLASTDEASLGALLERMRQRDEDEKALADKEALGPSDEEAKQIREAFERAKRDYDDFVVRTGKFAEEFDDVGAAFSEWRTLRDERNRLRDAIRRFARECFGCEPDDAMMVRLSAPSVSDEWKEVSRFVRVAASPEDSETIDRLVCFLNGPGRDPSWWDKALDEAQRHERLSRDVQSVCAAVEAGKEHVEAMRSRVQAFVSREAEIARRLGRVLDACDGDPEKARQRWEERRSLLEHAATAKGSLATLLGQFGASSIDELREKRTDASNRAAQSLAEWMHLVHENRGLPETNEAGDPERVDAKWRSLNDDVERLRAAIAALEKERGDLSAEQWRLERGSPLNIAQAELELAALKRRREEVQLLADALTVAHSELRAAVADYQGSYRALLQEAATAHFATVTGKGDRVIVIEDDFRISVREGGAACDLAQLSKGAQDQLYMAIRLAVADLLAHDYQLPLVFDDPFAACDSERLASLREVLQRMAAKGRQILVLSHLRSLAEWGTPVDVLPC